MADENAPNENEEDTKATPIRSAIKSLGQVLTNKKSLADSVAEATTNAAAVCTCPNCAPAGFCSLEMVVLLLALPCLLHFYYYYIFDSSAPRAGEEKTSDSRKVLLTVGFLGLLVALQLALSYLAVPSDAELREWEEKADEHSAMLLMAGTLLGFLVGVLVVRALFVGNVCHYCGRERE